jgi:UPF0176 protein
MSYQVLLYYKYTEIENPVEYMAQQRELCERLGFKGRVLIAKEGINGTLEGTVEATEEYIKYMHADPRFADMQFKRSAGTGEAFPKLKVKVREEIVSTHLGKKEQDIDPRITTGKYLSPDELHAWFESDKEFYIVDMRNDYEFKAGYFENSLFAPFANFRSVLEQLKDMEDKTIVTVCTGGVRCEKASGFLVANGYNDVYQLHGGMHTYMEKYPNQHFLGKLFVFDGRMLVGFNTDSAQHVIVGRCDMCGKSNENYVNCSNLACHKLMIACEECLAALGGTFCSAECAAISKV